MLNILLIIKNNMNTAQLLMDNLKNFNGHAALYRLNPPLKAYDGETEHELVVLSTARPMYPATPSLTEADHGRSRSETFIFPANKKGEVIDWLELPGSQMDATSHQKVLEDAGYVVVNQFSEKI
jgi:hypothetical protein